MKGALRRFGSRGHFRASAFGPALLLGLLVCHASSAQEQDLFEGALWKFEMAPLKKGEETRSGRFRVSGKNLFQKEKRDSPNLDKVVGRKDVLARKRTRLMIEDLRSNNGKFSGMKGTVVLNMDRLGEWSGRMVDSDGAHWDFKCSRVQE